MQTKKDLEKRVAALEEKLQGSKSTLAELLSCLRSLMLCFADKFGLYGTEADEKLRWLEAQDFEALLAKRDEGKDQ